MWELWRVHDALEDGTRVLPDRQAESGISVGRNPHPVRRRLGSVDPVTGAWRGTGARKGRAVAPGVMLYGGLDAAAGVVADLRRRGVRLVLADPRPARGAAGPDRPARERFAAAAVLEGVLAAAGRDLMRGGLVRALSRMAVESPGWPALDHGRVPLTGSRDVRLIRLDPAP